MRIARMICTFLMLFALALCSCKTSNQANAANPAPLTTITAAQAAPSSTAGSMEPRACLPPWLRCCPRSIKPAAKSPK